MNQSLIPINHSLYVKLPTNYDFEQNLSYMARNIHECRYRIHNNAIHFAAQLAEASQIVIASITADQTTQLCIRVLAASEPLSSTDEQSLLAYVTDWLDLDRDLSPFYELGAQDRLLHSATTQFHGLRIVGMPNLFEALAWGIMGQQINLSFAFTLKKRFVTTYGTVLHWEGYDYYLFPKPDVIASLTIQDLTSLQLTTRKSEYLIGIAKLIAARELTKEQLIAVNDITLATKQLVAIRGIGPWTANYCLLFCLRYPNAFPIDDVGLQLAIKHQLELDRKPTTQEMISYAKALEGWEAYATFYLWRILY